MNFGTLGLIHTLATYSWMGLPHPKLVVKILFDVMDQGLEILLGWSLAASRNVEMFRTDISFALKASSVIE